MTKKNKKKKRETEKKINCVAYLSTDGDFDSIEYRERNQLRCIREYACAHNINITRIREAYNAEEIVNAKKERRQPVLIPHFSCHHLRHTFCSRFCENETNVKVIQSVMGHANIETTMNIYAEVTDDKKKAALEDLARNLDVF